MAESILAQLHRQHMRQTSNSQMYAEPPAPAARPNLYKDAPVYGGLTQYSRDRVDPLAKRADESDEGHSRRIAPHLKAAQDVADAQAQAEWQQHRTVVDGRQGARGIFGNDERAVRQAAAAAQQIRANSMTGQAIAQNGGLTTSIGPAPARVFLSQIPDGPAVAVRSAIPVGSSGSGWVGVDQ